MYADDVGACGVVQIDRLLRNVRAHPEAPRLVAVTGSGGSGKSLALASLRAVYARERREAGRQDDTAPPLVVDDVHTLGEDGVSRIVAAAQRPGARVAVAFRPWPVERGLADLRGLVGDFGATVQLDPLDRDQVAARARRHRGTAPGEAALDDAAIDTLAARTGGVLRLVDAVLDSAGARPWDRAGVLAAWDPVRRLAKVDDSSLAVLRDVVLALCLGAPADPGSVSVVLGRRTAEMVQILEHLRVSGLLRADGTVVPAVREAVLGAAAPERRGAVLRGVLGALDDRGDRASEIAERTAGLRLHDPALARVRTRAAHELLDQDPAHAAELFVDAIRAGADGEAIAADRARSAALAGDLHTATRLADEALAHCTGHERAQVAHVLGAVLAHDGLAGHAAAVYRPLADAGDPAAAQLWSLAALAAGQAAGRHPDWPVHDHPPSLLDGGREAMVRGVQQSLEGDGTVAISTLLEAAAVLRTRCRGALLPDTPAALAALVALHCGEGLHATTTLREAVASGLGGPVAEARHHLLLAWTAMLDGRLDQARAEATLADRSGGAPHGARDELFAAALELGLARRSNDLSTLVNAWPRALEILVRRPPDLFSLLPLGEIAVAAARLDESARVASHMERATALLDGLGHPVLWSAPLHWYGIQVAIVSERPDLLALHAGPLRAAAQSSRYAQVLADAARVWLQVLGERVDPPAVERAARRLARVGMAWDGARLVGHAAARTPDRPSMVSLLQLARSLRPPREESPPRPTAARAPHRVRPVAPSPGGAPMLSVRELEVARLVVDGRTYREIAERLYISPKTVEHHVARMRQRLGVSTRGELLAHLRGRLASTSVVSGGA